MDCPFKWKPVTFNRCRCDQVYVICYPQFGDCLRHQPHKQIPLTSPDHTGMYRIRPLLLVSLALLSACAGITPAPRYTGESSGSSTPGTVGSELESRQRARAQGSDRRLMRVIEKYLGIPYLWGGTTRRGMDCSALTRAVVREAYGVELPRTSRQMYRLGRPTARGALRAGDLVFFRIDDSGPGISHVGIYVGDGQFAHASSSRGAVIDPLGSSYFDKRYAGARRILLD